jgi:hypothetical protein
MIGERKRSSVGIVQMRFPFAVRFPFLLNRRRERQFEENWS